MQGEAGGSLSIELAGPNRGKWYDHATDEGGDLIGLYRAYMGYTDNSHFDLSLKEIARDFPGDPVTVLRPASRPTPLQWIEQAKVKLGTKPRPELLELGAIVRTFWYLDINRRAMAAVHRYEPDGKRKNKTFRPHCYKTIDGKLKWTAGMPTPRPLYHLPEIAKTSEVILVEGEGKADALTQALDMATTSIMGGANAVDKTDWQPLAGKMICIWPDNDQPGRDFATAATAKLLALGCRVWVVPIRRQAGEVGRGGLYCGRRRRDGRAEQGGGGERRAWSRPTTEAV